MTRYINMSPRSGSSDIFLGFLLSHQGSIPGEGWGLWGGGRQKFKKQKKKWLGLLIYKRKLQTLIFTRKEHTLKIVQMTDWGFVPNRDIHDNILVAHQILSSFSIQKRKYGN